MAAPRQVIHGEARRIGGLHEKDAVSRNAANGAQLRLAGEDMEGVQYQADIGVRGAAYHFPAVAVIVNMAAPGQRLIGHAQMTPRGTLAQLIVVIGGTA